MIRTGSNTSDTTAPGVSHALQSTIDGDVFVPGDDGSDDSRRAFLLGVDQRRLLSCSPSRRPMSSERCSSPTHKGCASHRRARATAPLVGPSADRSLASFEVRHLGGALARHAWGGGAQAKIDAEFAMVAGGPSPTPELRDTVRAQVRAVKDALTPWRADYDYYNFVETPAEASAVLPSDVYLRLQQIKADYDPDQVIISAHPVKPDEY